MASEHKKDKVKKNHFAPTLGQIHPCVPTLKPFQHAVPSADAQALLTAFSGIGCDQHMVMNILTHRSSAQIEQIKKEYQFITGKSLIDRAASELYEPAEYLAVCRLYTGPDADAYILRRATKGAGTDDNILIHILSTRSSAQMACIKEIQNPVFKKPLLDHVRSDTSGSYKDVLTYLIEKPRSLAPGDHVLAAQQATMMYSRSIVNITASEKFIPIFGDSSYEQIKMIGTAFQQQFGKPLVTYLEQYSGNYELVLRSVCHFSQDPLSYFAKFLKDAIVNERIRDVICLITTRCEIDLASILNTYSVIYQTPPDKDIKNRFKESHSAIVSALEMLMGLK